MAITGTTHGLLGPPVERLRSLTDTEVALTTTDGEVTGRVLSCSRVSVWLVCDDTDVVVALDDIVEIVAAHHSAA